MAQHADIHPVSYELANLIQKKIDNKTKPAGSLGDLEELAMQICLLQSTTQPSLKNVHMLVFAGDHGLAASGVSAYPQDVTKQMVHTFLEGGAAINVFSQQHGIKLKVIDAGVIGDFSDHHLLIHAKIDHGTKNTLYDNAMNLDQFTLAVQKGSEIVTHLHKNGCNCIGFGEMGIGNTSAASLIMHALTNEPLENCVGKGTGLEKQGLQKKVATLHNVIKRHQNTFNRFDENPKQVLQIFGGFEMAMLFGAMIKAAEHRMLILIDGFIVSTVALVLIRCFPHTKDAMIFSHCSDEQGHALLLQHINAKPLLNLHLRLGEGSGAALAFPLVQSAVEFINKMASFEEAGVSKKTLRTGVQNHAQ